MRRKNPEDARIIGLALRRLRWDAGLTLAQLSEGRLCLSWHHPGGTPRAA